MVEVLAGLGELGLDPAVEVALRGELQVPEPGAGLLGGLQRAEEAGAGRDLDVARRDRIGPRLSQRAAVREEVGSGMRIRLGRTGPRGVTGFFAGNGRVQKWGVVGPFLGVRLLGERADGPLPPR